MPTSVVSTETARGPWRALLVPLAVLLSAALLTVLFYRRFETALEVLAPAVVAVCAVVVAAGAVQRAVAARRARRRARAHPRIGRLLAALAAGRTPAGAAEVGRSWRTLDAARGMAAARPPHEREAIRRGLGAAGAWRRVARRAARSRRKWERVRALQDLGWLGVAEAAPVVRAALDDADDDVAWAALAALGGMEHDDAYELLLDRLGRGRFAASRVAQVLETSRHPRPLPLLRARLGHGSAGTLFWVAYLLGRSGDPGTLDALLPLAGHPDPDVRASAAEAMGRLGDRSACGTLLRMTGDDAWFVRLHACRSLGDLGARGAAGALRAATRDPDWWVRRSAADALRRVLGAAA